MHIQAVTAHAAKRFAQRGFKDGALETLYAYGRVKRRHGADIFFMDRRSRRQAEMDLGRKEFARLEKALNSYIVVGDDGTLVTCAKRLRRIR